MNPKVIDACHRLGIKPIYDAIRLSYEANNEKAIIYGLKNGAYKKISEVPLIDFSLFIGILVYGDALRFGSGIDIATPTPILRDNEVGDLMTVAIDIPADIANFSYDDGPHVVDFSELHEGAIREGFTLN